MGFFEDFGENFGDTLANTLNPFAWHQIGQARDEARTIRKEDIARDQANFDSQSITNRINEGMNLGLSLSAAAGLPPSSGMSTAIGQDTSHLSMQSGQSYDPLNALQKRLLRSQIASVDLDNLKKQQDLEKKPIATAEVGAGFMPGGSQSVRLGSGVVEKPMERTASYKGKPYMEAGAINSLGFEVTPTGLAPIPSGDIKQRIEDSPYELRHAYRNAILPNFGDKSTMPPKAALPKWADKWEWSYKFQEWAPAVNKKQRRPWALDFEFPWERRK